MLNKNFLKRVPVGRDIIENLRIQTHFDRAYVPGIKCPLFLL